ENICENRDGLLHRRVSHHAAQEEGHRPHRPHRRRPHPRRESRARRPRHRLQARPQLQPHYPENRPPQPPTDHRNPPPPPATPAAPRAPAHKVAEALVAERPSPLAYTRTSPQTMADGYLDAVANVQKLALRTRDRYKAALDRFRDFCRDANVTTLDAFDLAKVEDFVQWLRGQKRNRNGSSKGSRDFYKVGGIKFVLSTCRTAFNWAAPRRPLPPVTPP